MFLRSWDHIKNFVKRHKQHFKNQLIIFMLAVLIFFCVLGYIQLLWYQTESVVVITLAVGGLIWIICDYRKRHKHNDN